MSITIRPADLDADAGAMIKLLTAHVNPRYDQARFDWLYRRNPHGPGRAWLAVDSASGEIIGTAAALPRRLLVQGEPVLAWVLGDFCVADRYRALGPALQLQRACLAPVTAGEIAICYDFPSAAMMAIYRRLRISPLGQMRRLVYPLRVDPQLRSLPLPSVIRRGVAGVGNLALDLRRRRGDSSLASVEHVGEVDAEFTTLSGECAGDHPISVQRSAEYLRWRFQDNPFQPHEILTVRNGNRLAAYAIMASHPEHPVVVDLFGPADPRAVAAVVDGALAMARDRGAASLGVTLFDSHPWVGCLTERGFHMREAQPVVVYTAAPGRLKVDPTAAASWLLTNGDRDS
jgi:hypothetical protein